MKDLAILDFEFSSNKVTLCIDRLIIINHIYQRMLTLQVLNLSEMLLAKNEIKSISSKNWALDFHGVFQLIKSVPSCIRSLGKKQGNAREYAQLQNAYIQGFEIKLAKISYSPQQLMIKLEFLGLVYFDFLHKLLIIVFVQSRLRPYYPCRHFLKALRLFGSLEHFTFPLTRLILLIFLTIWLTAFLITLLSPHSLLFLLFLQYLFQTFLCKGATAYRLKLR